MDPSASEITGLWLRRFWMHQLELVVNIDDQRLGILTSEGLMIPKGRFQNHLILVTDDQPTRYMKSLRGRWYDPTPEEVESISPRQRMIVHYAFPFEAGHERTFQVAP